LAAATTILVAIALAVIVPVVQLKVAVEKEPCCCPNPDACKCKHKSDPLQTSMKRCHGNAHDVASTTLPEFVPPAIAEVDAPARPLVAIIAPLSEPHRAPAPRRPDAPS
jgi:hypothetical protein